MKITTEINDYSKPAKTPIRVRNHWNTGRFVELEVNGERYTVKGSELISANYQRKKRAELFKRKEQS